MSSMRGYDISRSYDWNYEHAPGLPGGIAVPACPGAWDFCGLATNSPLGVPAAPLLNSRWIGYYARLGFDVLTYKTVRSSQRPCYDLPNLLPVRCKVLRGQERDIIDAASTDGCDSWAISFGMPSRSPDVWRKDIAEARRQLGPRELLVVSVVASPEAGWTVQQIADDYVRCAEWAAEAGAHAIEANFSCPNVCSAEGEIYLMPEAARLIAALLRRALGDLPLILKIGVFAQDADRERFIEAIGPAASAISTANTVRARVRSGDGSLLFSGQQRGIGGRCVGQRSFEELVAMRSACDRLRVPMKLISVGGVSTAEDVEARLAAGAHHVQIATAAMLDPLAGIKIRQALASRAGEK